MPIIELKYSYYLINIHILIHYTLIRNFHFNYRRSFAVFLLFSIVSINSFAQRRKQLQLSADAHYGLVVAHKPSMLYLIDGHATGAEINIFKTTSGEKQWQRDYNLPECGISIFYISFANSKELGYGISTHPYVNLPLLKGKTIVLKFKLGAGLGYISRTFDPVENFKNNAMGSHYNAFVNLRLNADYKVTDNIAIEFGLGHSHFSNGASVMPNLGINAVTLDLGARYRLAGRQENKLDTFPQKIFKPRFEIVCIAGGSRAEVNPPTGKGYTAFTVSLSTDWLYSPKSRFLIGAEVGYNGGTIEVLKKENVIVERKKALLQEGVKAGYALRLGATELPIEFGYYIHTLTKLNGHFFHRVGIRHYFPCGLIANITLKTHWLTAYYWEAGIGYAFRRK